MVRPGEGSYAGVAALPPVSDHVVPSAPFIVGSRPPVDIQVAGEVRYVIEASVTYLHVRFRVPMLANNFQHVAPGCCLTELD